MARLSIMARFIGNVISLLDSRLHQNLKGPFHSRLRIWRLYLCQLDFKLV